METTAQRLPVLDDCFPMLCRVVNRLLAGFLVMSVGLAVAAYLLRDHVPGAAWGRVIGLLVASPLYLLFANRMAAGKRWAYVRLRVLSVVGTIGIAVLVSVPGPYPVWMRIEQGVQGLVLLGLAVLLAQPAIRFRFARRQPR